MDRIIMSIARENALFAIATALPNIVPSLIELPWAFGEFASDTAFLTANQIRMAFQIAAACGHDVGFSDQKGDGALDCRERFRLAGAGAGTGRQDSAGRGPDPEGRHRLCRDLRRGQGIRTLRRRRQYTSPRASLSTGEALEHGKQVVAECFSRIGRKLNRPSGASYRGKVIIMRLLHVGIALSLATAAFADTVTLKNGRVIEGTYLGGSARQVRVEVGDQIRTLDVGEIDRIEFGGPAAPPRARHRGRKSSRSAAE